MAGHDRQTAAALLDKGRSWRFALDFISPLPLERETLHFPARPTSHKRGELQARIFPLAGDDALPAVLPCTSGHRITASWEMCLVCVYMHRLARAKNGPGSQRRGQVRSIRCRWWGPQYRLATRPTRVDGPPKLSADVQ